jgi:hypothetical protein
MKQAQSVREKHHRIDRANQSTTRHETNTSMISSIDMTISKQCPGGH